MTDYLQHPVGLDTPGVAAVMDELSLWSARFGLLLLEHVELRSGMQILDLGCGTGFPTFELAQLGGSPPMATARRQAGGCAAPGRTARIRRSCICRKYNAR